MNPAATLRGLAPRAITEGTLWYVHIVYLTNWQEHIHGMLNPDAIQPRPARASPPAPAMHLAQVPIEEVDLEQLSRKQRKKKRALDHAFGFGGAAA